jgi:hypothetical protein
LVPPQVIHKIFLSVNKGIFEAISLEFIVIRYSFFLLNFLIGLTRLTDYDILFPAMSKRFLKNFWLRKIANNFSYFRSKKRIINEWGRKQIEKSLQSGQKLIVMQMG